MESAGPHDLDTLIEEARAAQDLEDVWERLRRWIAVFTAHPHCTESYLGAARALLDLQRYDHADKLLTRAGSVAPDSAEVAELQARIPLLQGSAAEAVRRFADCRQRFPEHLAGYAGGIEACLAVPDVRAADALAAQARNRWPDAVESATAWADVAERAEDWQEAERRWAWVSVHFPAATGVRERYARALLRNQQWGDAEELVQSALADHGDDLEWLQNHAECAAARGQWDAARARWCKVLEAHPDAVTALNGYGAMLRRAGWLDDAATLLIAALRRFENDDELQHNLAWTLTLQREWADALILWEHLRTKYPERAGVEDGCAFALAQAQLDLEIAAVDGLVPFDIPAGLLRAHDRPGSARAEGRQLLLQFESLGDTGEFGLVQRHFGAEPIGLLRWATMPAADLLAALGDRFEGVGEAEHTLIDVEGGAYVARDARYGMRTRTFVPEAAEPLERFTRTHLRWLKYLRLKLIEDLETARKVFVCKSERDPAAPAPRLLLAAIRRYNPHATLLSVRVCDARHPAGSVEAAGEGLFIGYVDRFSTVDVDVDAWAEICRRTRDLQVYGEVLRAAS